jgi:hypothetical protein
MLVVSIVACVSLVVASFTSACASTDEKTIENNNRLQQLYAKLVELLSEQTNHYSEDASAAHPLVAMVFLLIAVVEFVILVEYFVLMFVLLLYKGIGF